MPSEPWDELMGPSKDDLASMLEQQQDPPARQPAVRAPSSSGSGAPPPADMFGSSQRWSTEASAQDASAATMRAVTMASEDAAMREGRHHDLELNDDDEDFGAATRIRQEALRMLEVADDKDSAYKIHKTTTGGFQASAGTVPMVSASKKKKRVPAALSGLVSAARGGYRDDPYAMQDGSAPVTSHNRDDYEYGDDSVVDVANMESRFAGSRPTEDPQSWSSRYSVDRTLLALSGGAARSSRNNKGKTTKYLDDLDKENQRNRTSARNLLGASADRAKAFGQGFTFRTSKLFGQQGKGSDTASLTANLKTQWTDNDRASTLGPASPAKSWQEQLARKRQFRRRAIMLTAALLFMVTIIATFSAGGRKRKSAALASGKELSFFITSNVPYNNLDQAKLDLDLRNPILEEGAFLIHAGNIQDPQITRCRSEVYRDVAERLKVSPIPTFVVPGSHDYNNCPSPEEALDAWRDNFVFFDTNWYYEYTVEREVLRAENFSVLIDGVLVIGLFEVEGLVLDWDEFQDRGALNVNWIESRINKFGDQARAIVVVGESRPRLEQNTDFFDNMAKVLEESGKPSIYFHSNTGTDQARVYAPYGNYAMLSSEAPRGGQFAPMKVTVGYGDQPFTLG